MGQYALHTRHRGRLKEFAHTLPPSEMISALLFLWTKGGLLISALLTRTDIVVQ